MNHSFRLHRCLLSIGCLALFACSGSQLRDNETETFQPRILDDGSKLFDYRLDSPDSGGIKPALVFDANEPTDMNAAPEMSPYSADNEKVAIETRVLTLLDKKLATTGYCREGYVVIDKMIGFSHSSIRGECRETATDTDREQFSQ